MDRFTQFIVKKRKWILIVAILLLIPSAFGYLSTYVNYDILTYLPDSLESIIGEKYLENDFKTASTGMITIENMSTNDTLKLKDDLSAVKGVEKVIWTDDLMPVTVPKEMLPADIQKFFYNDSGATLMIVKFSDTTASASTIQAVEQIKKVMKKDCFLGGMSALVEDTKALAEKETPYYVIAAVGLSIIVLMAGLSSTVVPFIFMLGMVFAIAYNFGTNCFLGQISYITKALATVLQLGVTMDFSIFLLHRYEEEKLQYSDHEQAMAIAIKNTFASITGSSLTVMAGFLAMCTMSFTLGRDIGIVMAKGVFFGVTCTLIILPCLILTFDRAVEKHTHRTLIPRLAKSSRFVVKHYKSILAVFIIIVVPFIIAQSKTDVYYTLIDSLPKDLTSIQGTDRLKQDFNMTTTHFIIVDENLSNDKISRMSDEIGKLDGVEQVLSYEKFVGGGIPQDFVPQEVKDVFNQGGKRMILANSSYKSGSDEQNLQIEQMQSIVKSYDSTGVITGEGAMTKDLIQVAATDFKNVDFTSILTVFLILVLVFRSGSIPVLLVAAIESAVMVNLGIPYFQGSQLPFISNIVVGTIQLGATVDYGILLMMRFREERRNGRAAKEAVQIAVETCSQAILSSGFCLFAATIGVALISRIELIRSLCMLIARGAVISMFVILFILPTLMVIFSKLIEKTTFHWLKGKN